MNWLDILIIVVVGLLAFMGWRRGVLQVVIALGGVIVGIAVAGRIYKPLGSAFSGVIDSEGMAQIAAFAVIFLAIMAAAMFLGRLVRQTLRFLLLAWVDNLAGMALGALVGAAISSALIIAMGVLPVASLKNAVEDSALATGLVDNMRVLLALLPKEFDQVKGLL